MMGRTAEAWRGIPGTATGLYPPERGRSAAVHSRSASARSCVAQHPFHLRSTPVTHPFHIGSDKEIRGGRFRCLPHPEAISFVPLGA